MCNDNIVYFEEARRRRDPDPTKAVFEILQFPAPRVLVDGLMPIDLANEIAALVERYNAGEAV